MYSIMRPHFFAIAILLATPAQAWNFCDQKYVPPTAFDREPAVRFQVITVPDDMLAGFCEAYGYPTLGGCADQASEDLWWIKVRSSLTPSELVCVIRHEKGHLNGWKHPSNWPRDVSRDAMQVIIDSYRPDDAVSAVD